MKGFRQIGRASEEFPLGNVSCLGMDALLEEMISSTKAKCRAMPICFFAVSSFLLCIRSVLHVRPKCAMATRMHSKKRDVCETWVTFALHSPTGAAIT